MAVAQKVACEVERLISHGEHVYTVTLRAQRVTPRFRPGQFLHLALEPYDASSVWPDSRVFSIASSPSERERLRISYSVRGRFTARMEAELAEGRQVWVKLPYGDFVVDSETDVVLLAGGTGITAFTAFLEGLVLDDSRSVYLVYGARRESLLIYRDLVRRRVEALPSLHVAYFIEQGEPPSTAANDDRETIGVGRLSVAAVWPRIRQPMHAAYYISGPPAMLQAVSQDLLDRGVDSEAIKTDAWE